MTKLLSLSLCSLLIIFFSNLTTLISSTPSAMVPFNATDQIRDSFVIIKNSPYVDDDYIILTLLQGSSPLHH